MMTTRTLNALLLAGACLAPPAAQADLVLNGYSAAGPLSTQERIWIRDGQLRRDFVDRGRAYTQLFDLVRHQIVVLDHASRMVETTDLKTLEAGTEVDAPSSGLKMTLTPTGETRPLRHWTCVAHTFVASMPARLGGEDTVFHLQGKVWVASGTPEQAAVKQMVELARQKDFFLGVPAAVKATPAQSRMLSELIRTLAPRGLPCAGELDARYEGNGPMANLARRLPARLSLTIQDFSDAPIKPEMFVVPPGYRSRS